jgi:hypothetical protein
MIMEAYQKRNNILMECVVAKDTTRDYEDLFLALLEQSEANLFLCVCDIPPLSRDGQS